MDYLSCLSFELLLSTVHPSLAYLPLPYVQSTRGTRLLYTHPPCTIPSQAYPPPPKPSYVPVCVKVYAYVDMYSNSV